MLSSVLSHLLAAIFPVLLFFLYMHFSRRRRFARRRRAFWQRQKAEGVKYLQFAPQNGVAAPLNFLGELESARTALQTVSLAIDLNLFEFLEEKRTATVEAIGKYLNFSPRHVYATLELLLAADVLCREGEDYRLSERARMYLLKESPFLEPLPPATQARRYLRIMRNGIVKGAVDKWSRGQAKVPVKWAMRQHTYSMPLGFALSHGGLLKERRDVLDVAGGSGAVCIGLALQNPDMKLQLLDLPGMTKITKRMVARYGLEGRIQCLGMDMFNGEWPAQKDAVLFTNIFHDWEDERCVELAKKAWQALKPGGLILVQEALLNEEKPGPLWTAHWSMVMSLMMKGRQFRGSELKMLVQQAGFTDIRIQPLLGYYSTLVGVKPLQTAP